MHDDNYDFEDDWGQGGADNEVPPHVGVLTHYSFEEAREAVTESLEELRLTFLEPDTEYGLGGVEFAPGNIYVDITVDAELECYLVFSPNINGQLLSQYSVGADQSLIILERDKYGLASLAVMREFFQYLLDDIEEQVGKVSWAELEQIFGEGERSLDIMNREGMPLEKPYDDGAW